MYLNIIALFYFQEPRGGRRLLVNGGKHNSKIRTHAEIGLPGKLQ